MTHMHSKHVAHKSQSSLTGRAMLRDPDCCRLHCAGKLSKAADVYAFGVLLWEMWTGSRPWSGLLQMQVIFHVTVQRKCLEFPSNTPMQLKELALACMSREPERRPRFEEVVERLGSSFCS